ncbi:ArnT family glycosyltransferase [Legionella clemsonensis]|uniref:Undecaprenyl phosphate-alpha-4-amino-4-deoxy-L-arabinose arabinosyl transferase n=1 Tax=Legionella clemsonensis TaxID=1867846 RepID=A0A222P0Y6_9GAMM|nr:glycosyltransferase family 39 protein [Legionella clemsonensis]ASQ45445.1 Undecaprenyl phosphate-alpha-4-amino-4-deoxy-L-arabinose arabinosyl transferase [Legionella clemsonensis]
MSKLQSLFLLTLFSLLLFLPGIAKLPAIDRDEAHFAQASRQMLQTNNYFQIRFQDKTRFQKPPGINWLQAASVRLFSHADATTIWPYRLPSLLGGLFSVLLLYFFARHFTSQRTALLAAGLFATSLLLIVETHMAVIDASLLFSVLLMQGSLWHCYEKGIVGERVHWGWAFAFWLALSFGMVLKGVTPLVGFLTIGALCLFERRLDWLQEVRLYRGGLLFLLLTLAWVYKVNEAEHSNYLMQMFYKDLLPKLQGGHESHGKPPLFHLLILPLTFWPASLFLWHAGVYASRWHREKIVKFLLAWLIPTWLFFEVMPTKLPQYVLPTFPAIALLCALAIDSNKQDRLPGKWVRFLQIMWGILSIGLASSFIILPYLLMGKIYVVSSLLFCGILLLTVISVYFSWQGAYRQSSIAVCITALITYPLLFEQLLPQLEPVWLTRHIIELIKTEKITDAKPLLVAGFEEPSLVFNLNTKRVKFIDSANAEQLLKKDTSRMALVNSTILEAWKKEGLQLSIKAHATGYNYTKGRWLELVLVTQQKENH